MHLMEPFLLTEEATMAARRISIGRHGQSLLQVHFKRAWWPLAAVCQEQGTKCGGSLLFEITFLGLGEAAILAT